MIPVLRAIGYMRCYWRLAALAFFSLFAATLLSLIVPEVLSTVVDRGLPQPMSRALFSPRFLQDGLTMLYPRSNLIFLAAVGLLGLSVFRAAVAFGQRYFGERLSQFVSYDLRNDFYDKVQHLPPSYHDQSKMGEIITRAITDTESVRGFLAQGFLDFFNVIILFFGVIIVMLTISPPLTVISLIPVPFIMAAAIHMGQIQTVGWRNVMTEMSSLSNMLEENVIGIQVVRAFNLQETEADHWAEINQRLYSSQTKFTETWSTYFPMMAFLVACCTALMLWQGGPQVLGQKISIGTIVALNGYILLLALPVQRLGYVVQQFSQASSSARRLFEIMDEPIVLDNKPDAVLLPRVEGHVRFEDVSLRYREGGPLALTHINLDVQPGQVIGIVGPTGSGKSSLVNLIPRLYDVTEGRVTIDGHDVRDVTINSLRQQIGIVAQETLLFTASIRDNIRYGRPDASDEDVIAAAVASDANRFVGEMPEGYETVIGERGVTLSGGQRQRVAIARALVLHPRILILDDSTASVDTRTENTIQNALKDIMKDCVTFIIAQRLSSVRHADVVLVMDRGQIIQRGTHDELILVEGLYRDIYRAQMEDQERLRAEIDDRPDNENGEMVSRATWSITK